MPWESRTNNPAQSDYFGVICRYFSCCFLLKVNSVCVWVLVRGGCISCWTMSSFVYEAESWEDGGLHSAGGRDLWRTHKHSLLSLVSISTCRHRQQLFPFPHLHNSILDFLCSLFFIPVYHGHCLSVGNISSGTENITEVTETTLTPTSTLAQQQEMYVLHLIHMSLTCVTFIKQCVVDQFDRACVQMRNFRINIHLHWITCSLA